MSKKIIRVTKTHYFSNYILFWTQQNKHLLSRHSKMFSVGGTFLERLGSCLKIEAYKRLRNGNRRCFIRTYLWSMKTGFYDSYFLYDTWCRIYVRTPTWVFGKYRRASSLRYWKGFETCDPIREMSRLKNSGSLWARFSLQKGQMEVVDLSYFGQIVNSFLFPKITNFLNQKTVLCHSFLGKLPL